MYVYSMFHVGLTISNNLQESRNKEMTIVGFQNSICLIIIIIFIYTCLAKYLMIKYTLYYNTFENVVLYIFKIFNKKTKYCTYISQFSVLYINAIYLEWK